MATITPTLTITANDSSHATPGPLSFSLSLNQSKAISGLTKVETKIMDLTAGSEADATHRIFDASAFTSTAEKENDGGYVYLRNMLADPSDNTHDIYIGFGGVKALEGDGQAVRLMTLKPGEFAFLPWSMTQDLVADIHTTHTGALEAWVFVKTTTA
tara:strand:- start:37 stop:507 length:471 start_codon:yes stop_codon:yes gene_type:complete